MATRKTKTTAASKTTRPSRSARKTSAPKKNSEKVELETHQPESSHTEKKASALKIKRSYLIFGIIALLLVALAVYYRSLFVVAMVNGQPISRLAYIQELEKLSGKQAMNSLVTKTLILQEEREKNISVSDQEVDKEMKTIEDNLSKQGQKLDTVLQLQGMTKESLREQVYLQKLIEKMVGKDVKVSDQEVNDYITANKETLPQDTKEEDLKKQVQEQLRQQKLNDKVQTWLQDLQQKAKVDYLIQQ